MKKLFVFTGIILLSTLAVIIASKKHDLSNISLISKNLEALALDEGTRQCYCYERLYSVCRIEYITIGGNGAEYYWHYYDRSSYNPEDCITR